jgi:hypothetical protein
MSTTVNTNTDNTFLARAYPKKTKVTSLDFAKLRNSFDEGNTKGDALISIEHAYALYRLSYKSLPQLLQQVREQALIIGYVDEQMRARIDEHLFKSYTLIYSHLIIAYAQQRKSDIKTYKKALTEVASIHQQIRAIDMGLTLPKAPVVIAKEQFESTADIILNRLYQSGEFFLHISLFSLWNWLKDKAYQLHKNPSVATRQWISEVNSHRLYWVWGNGLLNSILTLLPAQLAEKSTRSKSELSAISPITGYMSVILYFGRFAINLGLVIKHTIPNPWMSEAEKQIPIFERLKLEFEKRGDIMANDIVWGIINLVTFKILIDPPSGQHTWKGYSGDMLTSALLVFDLMMACIAYYRGQNHYQKEAKRLDSTIKAIEKAKSEQKKFITECEKALAESQKKLKLHEKNKKKLSNKAYEQEMLALAALSKKLKKAKKEYEDLHFDIKTLKDEKEKLDFEWKYERAKYLNTMTYSGLLLLAFTLAVILNVPTGGVPIAVITGFAVGGAIACFALSVAYTAIDNGIDIKKTSDHKKKILSLQKTLLDEYKATNKEIASLEEQLASLKGNGTEKNALLTKINYLQSEKKRIFIQLEQTSIDYEYQDLLRNFYIRNMVRGIIFDCAIPALVFAATFALPLTGGLILMGVGFITGLLVKQIINKTKPSDAKAACFDLERFNEFDKQPSGDFFKSKEPCKSNETKKSLKKPSFFEPASSDDEKPLKKEVSANQIPKLKNGAG